ncbi:hypothetical protein CAPTEDRAFT_212810 [Capitella teleta]|uniref:Nucleotide-diphospho-sugar transferase domain-containing protein n=1 Tax=Capitella teleta TaxID=283909 RepID=R7TE00_CAPTE|nr:hypothetical protein CAPTEDRAFT_212810 [Capitella teleta]|eukprot:ELT89266.1 hypothetical protein CAPTEDRAFT_212810 [Capitella teleta]
MSQGLPANWSRKLLALFVVCMFVYLFASFPNYAEDPVFQVTSFPRRADATAPTYPYNRSSYSIQLNGTTFRGKSLAQGLALLKKFKRRPIFAPKQLNPNDVTKGLAFVTYSSANHFNECRDAVATTQTLFPRHPIYFYDLGLSDYQIEELNSWCDVHYVFFNFSNYPEHVKKLNTYAFKPMLIQDMLNKHSTFFWMDASFRFLRSDISAVYEQALSNGGIVLFNMGFKITAMTHPHMFKYIPGNLTLLGATPAIGGDAFVRNTPEVYEKVLHWWFLCALVKDCIAPAGAEKICPETNPSSKSEYRGCHRFDQSALNILLANYHGYNLSKYLARPEDKYVIFVRRISKWHVLKTCTSTIH